MATLEKIRSKSVFLIIVIGVALLAFIVGDAISNGRNLFGKGTRIAKAGDKKIEISEYQQREQMLSDLYRDQGADQSEISAVALQQLIDEAFLDEAVDKMGIEVDDKDLAFYIFDMPLPPVQLFLARNFPPGVNATQASEMINNPGKYGLKQQDVDALKQGWISMESQVRKAVKRHLYENLMAGAVRPNTLDRKDMQARATESLNINLAVKPFDEALLAQYKVTDADINKLYNENKELFKLDEPATTIGFVYARVAPSNVDLAAAQKVSAAAADSLRNGKGVNAYLQKQGVRADKASLPQEYITGDYVRYPYNAAMIASAPVDSVMSYVQGNYYINVKKTGSTVANDSVEIAVFDIPVAQVADLQNVLKSGVAADSVAARTANKATFVGKDVLLAQNPRMRGSIPADVMAKFDNAVAGDIVTVNAGDSKTPARLARVEKAVPVTVYQFEAANYELLPSSNTMTEAREKLEAFGNKYKNADAFKKNAAAAGYQYMPYTINASTPNVMAPNGSYGFRSFPNSAAIVQWAMGDVTSGEISDVLDNNDSRDPWLYLAVVADQADEYLPVNDPLVKERLTDMAKRRKAGDDLVKKYSGKGDINATASTMGVAVTPVADMRFGGANVISDLPVSARIMGTVPGAKVYVVKGDNGVYAYQVVSKNTNTTPVDSQRQNGVYRAIYGNYDQLNGQSPLPYANIGKLLRGNKKVENNRYDLMGTK